jgi:hypothetical protein
MTDVSALRLLVKRHAVRQPSLLPWWVRLANLRGYGAWGLVLIGVRCVALQCEGVYWG